jgi:hypothetical protein
LASEGKIAFENSLGFQAQIDDLCLKWRILGNDPKKKSSGSNPPSRDVPYSKPPEIIKLLHE